MNKVAVMTDCVAAISRDLAKEYGITMIPAHLIVDGEDHLETAVDMEWFWARLKQKENVPTSAFASTGEFLQAYERLAQNSEAILFISVASALSKGYQAALEAKEMAREKLPQTAIEVIDSKTVCSSQMLIALEAGKAASQGKGVAEITQLVNGMIPQMNDISTRDTLFYLDKGGRILEAKSWAEAELKNSFRAIVEIDGSSGGVTKPVARAKTKTEAMEKMVDIAKKRVGDKRLHAAVIHANVPDQAAELKRMGLSQLQCDEFYVSEAFPVTAMHNGEGLIDFGFYCSG